MSINDFERCTPLEFTEIAERWKEKEQHDDQRSWEQVRMSCLCEIQAHSEKTLKATDVMTFPWDSPKKRISVRKKRQQKDDGLTNEERIERVKKLWKVTD